MQKKKINLLVLFFLLLCALSSVFYIFNSASFGKRIVGQGGIVLLALTVLLFVFWVLQKGSAVTFLAVIMTILQLLILFCWLLLSTVHINLFGLWFKLSSAWGFLFHLLMVVLGILFVRAER